MRHAGGEPTQRRQFLGALELALGGAPHMVTPVRPAAGSSVRASVSGFFLREPLTGNR